VEINTHRSQAFADAWNRHDIGCDVFTFRGDKIAVKNSYRKNRPPLPAGQSV
jgi:hypothetical protein